MEQIENSMVSGIIGHEPLAVVGRCSECESEIRDGEDYYEFEDVCICESCIRSYVMEHRRCG